MLKTPTSIVELEGKRYAILPIELLERYAPQLLNEITRPFIPRDPKSIPWEVVDRTLGDNPVSLARAWREYLELSQDEIAKRLGISQAAVSELEASERLKHSDRVCLSEALGITPEQLNA